MKTYSNPIMPGFYPDPSICRKDDDYYLVTSTFSYFPGVPIFHSKDLVHWEQIGNVLDRASQLNLLGCAYSDGIYAPTIRYHQGVFYMITTNVRGCGNFYVTATDPKGPWSDPILVDAEGIDPSLFFEDGKAYYIGQQLKGKETSKYEGQCEIWIQELDITTGKWIGEKKVIWDGSVRGTVWQEGPHLYKKDGYYYVMIAEGGTSINHSEVIARSRSIYGPYESNPNNPILTHRHFGKNYPITSVGHADIIEAHDGSWWMVHLGCRPSNGKYCNLGRETFLTNVTWEDGWPIINIGKGCTEIEMPAPSFIGKHYFEENACDHFENDALGFKWLCLRTPDEQMYNLNRRKGYLSLKLRPQTIFENENPSVALIRQRHKYFKVSTALEFTPETEAETAGLIMIQNNDYNIRFERKLLNGLQSLVVIQRQSGQDELIGQCLYDEKRIYLEIIGYDQKLVFRYGNREGKLQTLIEDVDAKLLSTEVAGGFVGTCIGMYASSNHTISEQYAEFDWFEYKEIKGI